MKSITKSFPGVIALEDVDFELEKGEVHILLGENGAGKSTLVKILSGAYQKTSGDIYLDGELTEIKTPKQAQELGVSIIYQELNLVPYISAGENIFLGREPIQKFGIIDYKRLCADAQRILDELNAGIDARTIVGKLGMAKQQMVEIAKALSLDAKILIMDEPTSALTEQEIKQLFLTIKQLKEKGVSIIYISHRLEELYEIGDRVTVLRDGQRVTTRFIRDVSKTDLIQLMVDRKLTELFPKQKALIGDEVLHVEDLNQQNKLKNIHLRLHRGEILGIAGLMGSGRTELVRAIFGADPYDSGHIFVQGEEKSIRSPQDSIRLRIGFLTEDRKSQGLILNLSLRENVCLPSLDRFSKWGIVDAAQEDAAANKYSADLNIKAPDIHHKVMYLSGGNQQKVVISKWLCSQADILIFDEPTRGIDVASKVEIYHLMNQLTSRGVAIIMISSELLEILGMSDRIIVMHQGEITGEFSAEDATQEKILHRALGNV